MGSGGQFGGDDELGWHFAEQQEEFGLEDEPGFSPRRRRREGDDASRRHTAERFEDDIEDRDYFRGPPPRREPRSSGPRGNTPSARAPDFPRRDWAGPWSGSRATARRDRPMRREDHDDERRSAEWSRDFSRTRAEREGDFDELPDDRRSYSMYAGREFSWEEDRYTERADERQDFDDDYRIGFSPGSAGDDERDDEIRYFSGRGRRHPIRRASTEGAQSRFRRR